MRDRDVHLSDDGNYADQQSTVYTSGQTMFPQGTWVHVALTYDPPVLKLYMEMDINLYDKCSRERQDKMKDKEIMREQASAKWDEVTKLAAEKGAVLTASDLQLLA